MDNTILNRLREELIVDIMNAENQHLSHQIKDKFNKLIELLNFSIMHDGDEFFAHFLIQLKKDFNLEFAEPCGTTIRDGGYTMYFNPTLFLECSIPEMQALIKHEIYHILSGHHGRTRALSFKYSSLAVNLAMDISINEYILNLPPWMPRLQNIKREYDVDLKENCTMEQYAWEIQKALDRFKNEPSEKSRQLKYDRLDNIMYENNLQHLHELWNLDEELDEQLVKEMTKKIALNAENAKMPNSVEELLRGFKQGQELSWKDYLKRLLGTLPSGYKKTSARRDRRQAERLDLRGRLRHHIAEVAVAIDISGSISDKEIEQIMGEVFAIVKNYPNKLTILECDSEVRRVYEAKNIRDIKKKVNTRGSTKFSPVFQYLYDKNMKNSIIIYFTDGLGEEELSIKPINRKTIWVLTGKGEGLSLKKPYGVIKKLNNIKIEKPEFEYAPNAIKEYRALEWSSF